MGFMQEFKDFAVKGNVVDMGVGIVIGAAFTSIVNSFVSDIINPIIGVITGGVFVANNAGGSVDVGQDQYLVTLPDGTQVELPAQPRFLRVDPIPNPESCE